MELDQAFLPPAAYAHREVAGVTEDEMEARFPWIAWRAPLAVRTPEARGLACRFCVAARGLRGSEVGELSLTLREHEEHLAAEHGR